MAATAYCMYGTAVLVHTQYPYGSPCALTSVEHMPNKTISGAADLAYFCNGQLTFPICMAATAYCMYGTPVLVHTQYPYGSPWALTSVEHMPNRTFWSGRFGIFL